MREIVYQLDGVVVAGAEAVFEVAVLQDGETLDLSGKTVTATVRRAAASTAVAHADLEHVPASVTDPEAGVVEVTLGSELTALLTAPDDTAQTRDYYLQLVVVEDHYVPGMGRFRARRPGAVLPVPTSP